MTENRIGYKHKNFQNCLKKSEDKYEGPSTNIRLEWPLKNVSVVYFI